MSSGNSFCGMSTTNDLNALYKKYTPMRLLLADAHLPIAPCK